MYFFSCHTHNESFLEMYEHYKDCDWEKCDDIFDKWERRIKFKKEDIRETEAELEQLKEEYGRTHKSQ